MDANPRRPDDPMGMQPDCGDAGDYERWSDVLKRDDRLATDAAYDEHKRKFVAAGGRGPKFDALNLMAAARLTAARLLNGLRLGRGSYERPATEHEVRQVLGDLARGAGQARCEGRFRAYRRRLWPFDSPPPPDGSQSRPGPQGH